MPAHFLNQPIIGSRDNAVSLLEPVENTTTSIYISRIAVESDTFVLRN